MKKILTVLGALALAVAAFFVGTRVAGGNDAPAPVTQEEQALISVRFITPDGEELVSVPAGDSVALPKPEELPHRRLIGWRSDEGVLETRGSITADRDMRFTAVYAVTFETEEHRAYLFPDELGRYRPEGEMSRGDAAVMLQLLLSEPVEGAGNSFPDLTPDSPFYEAADVLCTLGVIGEGRFHPEDGVTRAELLELLCAFYPPQTADCSFSDLDASDSRYPLFCTASALGWIESGASVAADADRVMTRAETAALMNRVLGRSADRKANDRLTGHLLDLPESDEAYPDMAEACIPHSWKTDASGERWTGCTRVKTVKAGLYLDGYELYAVDETGHLVRDGEYQGFAFDSEGRYTSGSAEVDALVRDLLPRVLDPDMDQEAMLHAVYRYIVNNYRYLKGNYYDHLDVSWLEDEAVKMLSKGKGNCYSFAAAFCVSARALGYDAVVYSGAYRTQDTRHAWVDIDIDGKRFMFDPEIENAIVHNPSNADLYMMTPQIAKQYPYIR